MNKLGLFKTSLAFEVFVAGPIKCHLMGRDIAMRTRIFDNIVSLYKSISVDLKEVDARKT